MARRRRRDDDGGLEGAVFALLVIGSALWVLRPEYRGRIIGLAVVAIVLVVAAILLIRWWRRQTAKTLMGRLAVAEQMMALSWVEFEQACAELFRSMGYSAQLTSDQSDDGVDIEIEKHGERAIVQCKHWPERGIGSPIVRDLLGARQDFRVADAYLLTSGFFSDPAKALAQRNEGLHLWDRDKLIATAGRIVREQLLRKEAAVGEAPAAAETVADERPAHSVADERPVEAEADEVPTATEVCPRCGRELLRRDGRRGAFMSCSGFPHCRYSRDLTEAEAAQ